MPPTLTVLLQALVDALRHELQQLGEMLALLDPHPAQPAPFASPASAAALHTHRTLLQQAREQRQTRQRQLAAALNQPASASIAQLLTAVPAAYQPLLAALVQENHELRQRVEQRAQQARETLRHSLERMRAFITALPPGPPAASPRAAPTPPARLCPMSSPRMRPHNPWN
ncbi:MAG: hypothetical protein JXQ71_06585 [Verrucomicrobia bacterium]|nr:hypothetical protein [Verrucomicrobiota bacterium]